MFKKFQNNNIHTEALQSVTRLKDEQVYNNKHVLAILADLASQNSTFVCKIHPVLW